MAGKDNLIKNSDLTPEQRKEKTRRAGIASGVARRRKKELRDIVNQALNTEINNEQVRMQLNSLGFEADFQSAIALKVVELATKGNLRAVEALVSMSSNKDTLDRKEQRTRIKKLELENERLRLALDTMRNQGSEEQSTQIANLLNELKQGVLDE